jgi:hypothetical protein
VEVKVGGGRRTDSDRWEVPSGTSVFPLVSLLAKADLGLESVDGVSISLLSRPRIFERWDWWLSAAAAADYVVAASCGGDPIGVDVEVDWRVFGPGMVGRLSPDEQAHITGGVLDLGVPAAEESSWSLLPPEANARALETWAKKQAYVNWLGGEVLGGPAVYSVLDPEALGVQFLPLAFGEEAPDLIGWVCVDAEASVQSVDSMWLGQLEEES